MLQSRGSSSGFTNERCLGRMCLCPCWEEGTYQEAVDALFCVRLQLFLRQGATLHVRR
jgi:hypothetical protein